jgi:NADH dehydrogenase (ubiquinone) 1 beta subcomplex subunit 2
MTDSSARARVDAASEGGGVTHEGVTLHDASFAHKALGSGFGAVMWFWVFYRFYHDGDVLLYGHAPHFEHDDHDDDH